MGGLTRRGLRGADQRGPKEQDSVTDNDHKKPGSRQDVDPKTKPCLVCKSPFLSEWAGERICRRCKSTAAWRSGVVSRSR
jgi:hypothetical protein